MLEISEGFAVLMRLKIFYTLGLSAARRLDQMNRKINLKAYFDN